MYSGITVGCVTIIGNKHISRQVPCEDASFAMQKNGVSVVCIADGAGGKKYTHARFGSACAVETISNILADHFDALYSENREAAVRSYLMAKIRIAFADIIAEKELDTLDQLSCTLLFEIIKAVCPKAAVLPCTCSLPGFSRFIYSIKKQYEIDICPRKLA